MSEVYRS